MTAVLDFLAMVEELVSAVEFDDGGMVIGHERVGGNGGLLSNETLKKASTVRLALGALREDLDESQVGNPTARQVVMDAMVACYRQASDQGLNGWRVVERTFPGTPADVVAEIMVRATDELTETWWRQVERTVEVELVRRALTGNGGVA